MGHEIVPELHFEIFIQHKDADVDSLKNGLGQTESRSAITHGALKRGDKLVNDAADFFDAIFGHEHGEVRDEIAIFDGEIDL